MTEINLVQSMHASTKRNYVQRVVEHDKAKLPSWRGSGAATTGTANGATAMAAITMTGRWRPLAQTLVDRYGIKAGMSVLDVGCGKGYLLYEFTQIVPGLRVAGIDISRYGVENAKEEVRPFPQGRQCDRPCPIPITISISLVLLGVLHNLPLEEVFRAVSEIERVGRGASKYLMVEFVPQRTRKGQSLYWQLTCLSFHNPATWAWIYDRCGYTGDHGFIFFE